MTTGLFEEVPPSSNVQKMTIRPSCHAAFIQLDDETKMKMSADADASIFSAYNTPKEDEQICI
jgi:hypothetical protein